MGSRLLREDFSLFVQLLLQLGVWDVQGSCLPSGILSDESSSACQELAKSIADTICNEDQTIDPAIIPDVLVSYPLCSGSDDANRTAGSSRTILPLLGRYTSTF
jgi:hypothetical protein